MTITLEKINLETYHSKIDDYGLTKVWNEICTLLKKYNPETFSEKVYDYDAIGWLYENGLAYTNKISKKELGKFYTPKDVACIMASLLLENDNNEVVSDIGCGTGNLILPVLEHSNTIKIIHLFDLDEIAINICEAKIISKYKNKYKIIKHIGNFLDSKTKIPYGSKVISNPPYYKFSPNKDLEQQLPALKQAKDLYVGFIEKILKYTSDAVIITPQSYLVGDKFSTIRKDISQFSGDIYAFDNVPASIFCGKKEGIFNSNTSNSVRAAILHLKSDNKKGFRLTHLIRFKQEEREKVLTIKYLKAQLGTHKQNLEQPLKCFNELEDYVYQIIKNSSSSVKDLVSVSETEFKIRVNNSARYFTVATKRNLERNGYFDIFAKDEISFYKLYVLFNSSYIYLFYRMLDGGILVPKSILEKIPEPSFTLTNNDITQLKRIIQEEANYLTYKKNAGKRQESVKFPIEIREKLNSIVNLPKEIELIHMNNETLVEVENE